VLPATSSLCSNCGTALASDALGCPSCGRLTHAQEFEALAQHAKLAGQAGDWHGARNAWAKALTLLPPDSAEYRSTKTRIENIDLQLSDKSVWAKRMAKLGPVGVLLWKFKTVALIVLGKGKLVLLGLDENQHVPEHAGVLRGVLVHVRVEIRAWASCCPSTSTKWAT
jgi:hypothetical protein